MIAKKNLGNTMENNHWKLTLLFVFFANVLFAQSSMLQKKVTVQYFNVKLEDALEEISSDYDVNFSYSIDRISVHQKVSADVENAPLSIALEDLLEETDITYASIGDQVVLKTDKKKQYLLSQRNKKKEKIIEEPKPQPVIIRREYVTRPLQIGLYREKTEELQAPIYQIDLETHYDPDFYTSAADELEEEGYELFEKAPDGDRIAQVSLFGSLGTNGGYNRNTTNKLSANIFWGRNGGVNGTEVGGILNSVVHDVKGIQVAGIGNTVGGNVNGTQVGGIFNVNRGETNGVQAAGIVNVGRETKGVQAAGILNVSRKGSSGIQAAGIGNVAGVNSRAGIQASGIFNVNRGNSNMQVAGLVNVSRGKTNLQVAGILNVGNVVKGAQVGIINIADSADATIGLINIVKRGYNRLEMSGSEVLYFNAEMKLGSRRFYNIFHFGFRPLNQSEGHFAYGYGVGTVISTKNPRKSHNLEVLATQINDVNQPGVNDLKLNLLNQLRWAMDFRVGRRTSLFFGPTFNVMVSKMVDLDSRTYNLDILPYTLFESVSVKTTTTTTVSGLNTTTIRPLYVAGWIGLNAGIRF